MKILSASYKIIASECKMFNIWLQKKKYINVLDNYSVKFIILIFWSVCVCVCVCIEIKYSLHIINLRFFKLRRKTFYNSEKYIYTTLNKYENIHIYKKNDEQEK